MNVSLDKMQKDFQELSHDDKKDRLLDLVDSCGDALGDATQEVKEYMSSPDVTDEYLNEIYALIITTAIDEIHEENQDMSERVLKSIKDITLKHLALEQQEKEGVDAILSSL